MPVEADAGHADAAQLHDDVGAGGDGGDTPAPLGHDLVVSIGVGAYAAEPSQVVQNDGDLGHGVGEVGQVAQLGKVQGVLQHVAHVSQHASASAIVVAQQTALYLAVVQFRAGVPADGVPDAPEAVGAGLLQRLQHGAHGVAKLEVGTADDAVGRLAGAVLTSGAGIGDGLHELDLAHRAHLLGTVGPVAGAGLHEHRGADIVAAVDVGGEVFQQILLVVQRLGPLHPEMMVRVADGDLRFQNFFAGQCQPFVAARGHRSPLRSIESVQVAYRRIIAQG